MDKPAGIIEELQEHFGSAVLAEQPTQDNVPTVWIGSAGVRDILRYLKAEAAGPYKMLYDLTAIDERLRVSSRESARKRLHGGLPSAFFRAQ